MLVAVAAQAQTSVFSVNIVGFTKKSIAPGFTMIANQLDKTNTTLNALIPNPPDQTQVIVWNGMAFEFKTYFGSPINAWFPDGNFELNPGGGAFIKNPTVTNVTVCFSGEVLTGLLTNPLPAGFSIASSQVPQALPLDALSFPAANGDKVFIFNNSVNNYSQFEYFGAPINAWFPSTPTPAVGESFFVSKGVAANWVRSFTVN
jgi:hypothetical protein